MVRGDGKPGHARTRNPTVNSRARPTLSPFSPFGLPLLNPSISISSAAAGEARREEMALYLLFESASAYALFHAYGIDEIGQSVDAVRASVLDLQRFGKTVKLAGFSPFSSAVDALNQCNAISEGIMLSRLRPLETSACN